MARELKFAGHFSYIMENLNPVGQLSKYYSDQAIVQALIQLVPGGGSLDILFKERAREIAEERATEFYEELSREGAEITPELIQSEDFIHRYVITAKAAANTHRREKIRLFARLLNSSFAQAPSVTTDEYEEYLSILDELSFREFSILAILEKLEDSHPLQEGENGLQRSSRFWNDFLFQVTHKFGINEDEVNAILARLNRTGCYVTFSGVFWDYDGNKGQLTELYSKLKLHLRDE